MHPLRNISCILGSAVIMLGLSACGSDDTSDNLAGTDGSTSGSNGNDTTSSTTGATGEIEQSLCAKYGGASSVDQVVRNNVIGAIAEDCRINTFFTALSAEAFVRVEDCLSIQVQELFGCEGARYEGAEASNGLPCRSMAVAHQGLEISNSDFNALIEDVVAGLADAGVEAADIEAAAPALLGMEGDIVEAPEGDISRDACSVGDE